MSKLRNAANDETIPAILRGGLLWSSSALPARRRSVRDRIVPARADGPGAFRFADVDETSLGLWEGDRPILVYNHGARSKKGDPAPKPHSCYIHPIYGLDGEVLTDDFPADHLHHRGLFWAWPHVTVDGRHHDLWMQNGIEPRFDRWGVRQTEQKQALLGVENGWYAGGRKVMSEQLLLSRPSRRRQGPCDRPGADLDADRRSRSRSGARRERAMAASHSGSPRAPTRRSRSHPGGPRTTCT